MCESFNFPLRGKKHNKLWFSSKQTNGFPYVSKRKLLFCYSACSTDDSSGEVLSSNTFSHVAGKMCFPTPSLCAPVISFEAFTPTLLLKGGQRTGSSRVWFYQLWGPLEGAPSQARPRGPETGGVLGSWLCPQSSLWWRGGGRQAKHNLQRGSQEITSAIQLSGLWPFISLLEQQSLWSLALPFPYFPSFKSSLIAFRIKSRLSHKGSSQ